MTKTIGRVVALVVVAVALVKLVRNDDGAAVRVATDSASRYADGIEMTLNRPGSTEPVTGAQPGEELELRYVAKTEAAEGYRRGLTSSLEQLIERNWRTVYGLASPLPDDSRAKPTFIALGQTWAVPSIALMVPGPDRVQLPPALDTGRYRICKELNNGGSMDSAPSLEIFEKCVQIRVTDGNAGR